MKSKFLIILSACAALASGLLIVNAQEPDDDVRGAFLSSRPKNTNPNATRRHRPPRKPNNSTSSSATTNTNAGKTYTSNTNNAANKIGSGAGAPLQAIGLGYTLFMRAPNGGGVRVEPDHEFYKGDRVRLALEPNIDGYLYVFHAEGDGQPEMIYPDWRLDAGENWIEAHVPIEVPSSQQADERFHWFVFDANPATEHLYVVVTREPLSVVPTGGDLVKLCSANKEKCPWRPSTETFSSVQVATKAEVKIVTSKTFGQAQTDKEKISTTRGLGLDSSAPEPAVIRLNAAPTAPILVAVVDLIHR